MVTPSDTTRKTKKKQFSSFTKAQAFECLGLENLLPWEIAPKSLPLSAFFQERWERLNRNFDVESYEESKKLLIDALCDEALNHLSQLKIWKGAQLEGEMATGYVDYLVAAHRRYLTPPLLCIIEAKKDDFEQGLAQCLVEMEACHWQNQQQGRSIQVFGIVTNGEGWRFYRMGYDRPADSPTDPHLQNATHKQVYETPLYSTGDMTWLLGRLHQVFVWCEQELTSSGNVQWEKQQAKR
jgi:hypothetical protein